MGRKAWTTENFIERAKFVHGSSEYDYSLVNYISSREKVSIICPKHGVFQQTAGAHIGGHGCALCAQELSKISQSKLLDIFIEEANDIHQDKYDYSFVKYVNGHTKIIIFCLLHELKFEQLPSNHLAGYEGCEKCQSNNSHLSNDEFIRRSKLLFGDRFDYFCTQYQNSDTAAAIFCIQHQIIFEQYPASHFSGCEGCPRCKSLESTERQVSAKRATFKEEANAIHSNRYDYSKSDYQGLRVKIEIMCSVHGSFWQTPDGHIHGEHGCPKCFSNASHKEGKWLDSLSLPDDEGHRQVRIDAGGKRFTVDGYEPTNNTIFEFYGDKWHGNPRVFNPSDIDKTVGETYGALFNRTMERERILKEAGYQIISVWECDWDKLKGNK